jgi:hypothetical protein
MVEVEGIPLPMLKPNLIPSLEEYPKVVIGIDGVGVETSGKLMGGDEDTASVSHIEELKYNGMDGVVPMELRGGNMDIT